MMAEFDTDVFDEVEEKVAEVETKVEETKEETKETKTETEKGVTEETEDKTKETEDKVPPTLEDARKIIAGLKATTIADRKIRQEETRLRREAERKLNEREIPNKDDDPEGYTAHLEGQGLRDRLEVGQDMMRDLHEDYEETEKVFVGLIADDKGKITDDSLYNKYANSRNPAKFAYDHAKKHLDLEKKSSDTYESDIRTNEREKVIAELKGKSLDELPDLTNAAASESNTQEKDNDPGDKIDAFDD